MAAVRASELIAVGRERSPSPRPSIARACMLVSMRASIRHGIGSCLTFRSFYSVARTPSWRDVHISQHASGEPRCRIGDVHWRIARQRVRQPGHSISQFIILYPAKEPSPPLISSLLTMRSSNLDAMCCSSTGSWIPPTALDSLTRIHNVAWLPLFALLTASRFLSLGEAGEGLALPLPREKRKILSTAARM